MLKHCKIIIIVAHAVVQLIFILIITTLHWLGFRSNRVSQEESNHRRAQHDDSIIIERQNDIYSQISISEQQPPDLNSLLNKLKDQVPNSQWYQFGQALQIPKEILDQLEEYSEDIRLTELLDYWLKNHKGGPTWQEVTEAQRRIEFYQQANGVDREQYSE